MTASTCNLRNFNRIDHYFVPLRKQRGAVQRAKRCLFGPIDHHFNEKWIQEQLTKQLVEDSFKYGIDFSNGRIIKLRGLKRPATKENDDKNVAQYYFQPIESDNNNNNTNNNNNDKSKSEKNSGKQEALLSPPASSPSTSTSTPTQTISGSTIRKSVKQSLLTDFMQSKKSCSHNVLLLKKDQTTERPNKILKLTDNPATTTNS